MAFTYTRVAFGVTWIALIGTIGLLSGATSFLHWILLSGIAVVPAVLAATLCRVPAQTLSESIQEARR